MRRLSVSFPGKAEIMEVSVRGNDPQEATILDRAVVDAYMKEVVESERDQKRGRLNELDRAFVEKETEIRDKREDLKKLAETLGTSDTETLTMKQKLALEVLGIYRQELAKSQFELRRLRSELAAQQSLLKSIDIQNIDEDVDLLDGERSDRPTIVRRSCRRKRTFSPARMAPAPRRTSLSDLGRTSRRMRRRGLS